MAIYQGNKELTLNNVSTVKHGGVTVYRLHYPTMTSFVITKSHNINDWDIQFNSKLLRPTNTVSISVTNLETKKRFDKIITNFKPNTYYDIGEYTIPVHVGNFLYNEKLPAKFKLQTYTETTAYFHQDYGENTDFSVDDFTIIKNS